MKEITKIELTISDLRELIAEKFDLQLSTVVITGLATTSLLIVEGEKRKTFTVPSSTGDLQIGDRVGVINWGGHYSTFHTMFKYFGFPLPDERRLLDQEDGGIFTIIGFAYHPTSGKLLAAIRKVFSRSRVRELSGL